MTAKIFATVGIKDYLAIGLYLQKRKASQMENTDPINWNTTRKYKKFPPTTNFVATFIYNCKTIVIYFKAFASKSNNKFRP